MPKYLQGMRDASREDRPPRRVGPGRAGDACSPSWRRTESRQAL